jgi:multidrug efflux pump
MSVPETEFTFQITSPSSGLAAWWWPPGENANVTFSIYLPEVQQGLIRSPASACSPSRRRPCPAAGQFPVEFVLAATEEPEKILEFAQAASAQGHPERYVRFSADH